MSLDFQSIKEELDQNEKAIIHLNNKKFLVKKVNNKIKIRPKFNWFINKVLNLILFVFSLYLIFFPLMIFAYIFDSSGLGYREYSDGTASIFSAYNFIHYTIREFWFVYFIIAILLTIYLYKKIGVLLMNILFKKEKQKILSKLNSTEKEMPIEEFTEILEDLLEIQEDDEDKINKFNAILNKAEKRINDIENEQ